MDPDYPYGFRYPASWLLEEDSTADITAGGTATKSLAVYDPNGAIARDIYIDLAQISVYKLNVTVTPSNMPDIKTEVQKVLSSLERAASDIEVIGSLSETTINGMDGFEVTYRLTKEGAPVTSTLYFLFYRNLEYQVTVQAAETNWSAKKPLFDAIMSSFKTTR